MPRFKARSSAALKKKSWNVPEGLVKRMEQEANAIAKTTPEIAVCDPSGSILALNLFTPTVYIFCPIPNAIKEKIGSLCIQTWPPVEVHAGSVMLQSGGCPDYERRVSMGAGHHLFRIVGCWNPGMMMMMMMFRLLFAPKGHVEPAGNPTGWNPGRLGNRYQYW